VRPCTDLEQLERWLIQAVTVQSVQELFSSKPAARTAATRGQKPKARKPRSKR
jgi:hypothetical protein